MYDKAGNENAIVQLSPLVGCPGPVRIYYDAN